MKILIVDLSNVFWTIALSGSSAEGTAARDFSLKDIRESAQGHDRVIVPFGPRTRLDARNGRSRNGHSYMTQFAIARPKGGSFFVRRP